MRFAPWCLAVALAFGLFSSCSCQRRTATDTPIAEGEPCAEDERCETGLCDSPSGSDKVCLRACTAGCRGSDVCTRLDGDRYACVPEKAGLCKACTQDSDCPQPADKCIVLGGEAFCGRDCSFDDACPSSFRCGEATTVTGALEPKQCQPTSGTCECIAATAGQQVPCDVSNGFGRCSGISVCRPPQGYDACSARTPAAEVCNGVDDDCNGMTDEGLGDVTCGVGECRRSVAACVSGAPQPCTAGQPGAETCNGLDDDCDGTVDDGFDTQTDVAHCGACNTACVLTNAVPGCALGRCTVSRCVAGWTDLDGVASNGCEYPCVPSDAGVEECNGADDDCDGTVDEDFDLVGDPLHCGQCNLACSVPGTSVSAYACVARVCAIGQCAAGRGNCNQQYGDGCEVDTQTDVTHCGQCGQACATPNATPGCDGGACAIAQCNTGFGDCNGQVQDGCEVDTRVTVTHCGLCGTACSAANATSACTNSACTFTCLPSWHDADGQPGNGCEYNCLVTRGGVEACDGIDNDCDNRVDEDFDFTSDEAHCGQCNRACSAPFATAVCSSSNCAVASCDSGRANCNALYVDGCEVNTQTDLSNCGACNNACTTANGTPRCLNGACGVSSCAAGFADCNNQPGDGCEVNTTSTVAHCGGCNQQCAPANAVAQCTSSACGIASCLPGHWNLNTLVSDGCEYACSVTNGGVEACDGVDNDCDGATDEGFTLATDVNNCGACGTVCAAANVTVPRCVAGQCGVQQCANGFENCNGAFVDGCEVDTRVTPAHCGACNAACSLSNATAGCAASSCTVAACTGTYLNCNNLPGDGCEVNGANTVAHCGACGNACTTANGTPRCTTGSCGIQSCNTGFADCNAQVADGCETNTTSSTSHCGGCGQPCAPAFAVPVCSSSTCAIASCLPGRVNLNGLVSDGCEYACTPSNGGVEACDSLDNDCDGAIDEGFTLASDVNNCGVCGNVCAAANVSVAQCSASQCGVQSCNFGFGNCNGAFADGCEVNTQSTVAHCGACGAACTLANATPTCLGGTCQVSSCSGNYRNCNGTHADGCEVNVAGNVDACGVCGNVCPARANASRTCAGTTCGYACNFGFVDIDGSATNGCEYACLPTGSDVPDDTSTDQDCDGIDGTASQGIFVSTSGNDLNPGTRAQPKRTVQAGIDAADFSRPNVYVSEGLYTLSQPLALRSGINVYGGYSHANNWARGSAYVVTLSNSTVASGRVVAVSGANVTAATTLAYLTIAAGSTAATGASVYGLHCVNCAALTVRDSTVQSGTAGAGGAGNGGSTGANGFAGDPGNPAGGCDNSPGSGGNGAVSTCSRQGGNGGAGGAVGDNDGSPGAGGQLSTPGGAGGNGCYASSTLCLGGSCTAGGGANGTSGAAGAAGTNGGGGSGGAVVSNYFAGNGGATGANGVAGNGGGGGGGGGGQGGPCAVDGGGNGGGGGGSGGCAGGLATGGGAGGSTFAMFLVDSTGARVEDTALISGNGGAGGAGGTGGPGGSGGSGGAGATTCTDEVGRGGNGGAGGNGGRGGHGGGGAGGRSWALYRVNTTATVVGGTRTFGFGGAGGASSGNAGVAGTAGAIF